MTERRVGQPVREPTPPWQSDLQEFAALYHLMYREIRARLEAYPSVHLRDLMDAADEVSPTNCGWTTYRVAPLVRTEAASILFSREQADD